MGLSTKNKEILFNPVNKNNPVIVQMLGICSALAVTVKLQPAIVMALSVIAVVAFANVIISLLRKTIPNRIRIIIQLVVVAALVTIVNEMLKAFAYDVSKQLSVYVGLIITNCILMGRLEAFALGNRPWNRSSTESETGLAMVLSSLWLLSSANCSDRALCLDIRSFRRPSTTWVT